MQRVSTYIWSYRHARIGEGIGKANVYHPPLDPNITKAGMDNIVIYWYMRIGALYQRDQIKNIPIDYDRVMGLDTFRGRLKFVFHLKRVTATELSAEDLELLTANAYEKLQEVIQQENRALRLMPIPNSESKVQSE